MNLNQATAAEVSATDLSVKHRYVEIYGMRIFSASQTTRPLTANSMMEKTMTTAKQRAAARNNIKKAQAAAKEKKTISHLPKATRTALGKEGAKTAKRKARGESE